MEEKPNDTGLKNFSEEEGKINDLKNLQNENRSIINSQDEFVYSEKLKPIQLVAYMAGSLANALLSGIVFSSISFYYTDKLFADSELIGLAWLLFMIWNTINDPIFGYITDNTRTKIGRRIPYIRYGAIFYGLSFLLCWVPFANSQWGLFWNFFLVLFLFDTMYSIIGTCFYCLPNEMTTIPAERTKLGIINTANFIIAIAIQMSVPLVLLVQGTSGVSPLFFPVMTLLAAICAITLFISSFFLKENEFAQKQEHEPFLKGILEVLKNKPFLILELGGFSLTLVSTTVSTGVFYYLDDVLEININAIATGEQQLRGDLAFSMIVLLVGLIIGVIISFFSVKKLGLKKVTILSFSLAAVGLVIFLFTGMQTIENAYPASIGFFIIAFGAAGAFIILPAVTGDVIDYDELITGKRREGVYAGFNAIVTKPAISIANWAFLTLIKAFGYVENPPSGHQSMQAKFGIIFAFTIVPIIFTALTALIMKWYPLDGEWWAKKKAEIIKMHEKKEEEYRIWLSKKQPK
ncbi:MAG: MFS transporter [Promethearchaeota archaeon]